MADAGAAARAAAAAAGLELVFDEAGLALTDGSMTLRADLSRMLPRLSRRNLPHELLVRAARVKGVERPAALDATAGLGEDSLLLAAAGFQVAMCERDPLVAALLRDALERAALDERLAPAVGRMSLFERDALDLLASLPAPPDVVYLDPMFPPRAKDAAVKKKFQLLHRVEPPCQDEAGLLEAAIAAGPRKVVVKRPAKGPWLAGVRPAYSVAGKSVRYDCVVPVPAGPRAGA